ncbi:cell wall metabolism sensor histidine kinase WalK [Leucobacter luti]|uniref:sensor histidine kinase n=1 Tax=Leucobacter luti TaxID=340320 RepID=UPI001C689EDF|nr:HAMP domain-containing sensor histidine kinase [Leucobacter luti]QYM75115.1 HAMP domain-containing histidine kinase [Leucobacter luti]
MKASTSALGPSFLRAWRQRFTIRTRLTVAFTALLGVAGAAIVFTVTVFMRTVPEYVTVGVQEERSGDFASAPDVGAASLRLGSDAAPAQGIVLRDPAAILNTSFVVSLIVLAVLVATGAAVAWVISGKMLRPLQAINQAAKLASTGSLDHRVALQGPKDELHDLSDTFDMMLGRLDDAFQTHRRFAANASHELRTPLAATETMLEVALSDPNITAEELRTVASRVLETNRRNAETVEALLALTEIEYLPRTHEPVSLHTLIQDVLASTRGEAMAMDLTLQVTLTPCMVVGDEAVLRQALTNLITNAIRHNQHGGVVEIAASDATDEVQILIENTGHPLTNERIQQLREPFARGDGRVEGGRRGHGLGLAIATTAVESHGGDVCLTPRTGGGMTALITFPTSTEIDLPAPRCGEVLTSKVTARTGADTSAELITQADT